MMFCYVERDGTVHQVDIYSDDDRAQALGVGGVDVTEAFATAVDLPDFATREGVEVARGIVAAWREPVTEPALLATLEVLEPVSPVDVPESVPALDVASEPAVDAPKRGPGRPRRNP